MTLSYETVPAERPSRRSLNSYGVFIALGAAFLLISAVTDMFRSSRAGGVGAVSAASLAVAALSSFIIAVYWCWLAVDVLRARRWVRPAIVGLSLWTILSLPAVAPTGVVALLLRSPSLGSGYLIVLLIVAGLVLLIPFSYWNYFRKTSTKIMLEFYQREPAWTDRWRLPVIAIGFVAATRVVTTLLEILAWIPQLSAGLTLGRLATPLFEAAMVAVYVLLCLRIYQHRLSVAYRFAQAAILIGPLASFATVFLGFEDVSALLNTDIASRDPDEVRRQLLAALAIGGSLQCVLALWVLGRVRWAFAVDAPTDGTELDAPRSPTADPVV